VVAQGKSRGERPGRNHVGIGEHGMREEMEGMETTGEKKEPASSREVSPSFMGAD
jgi:hypothetical protein